MEQMSNSNTEHKSSMLLTKDENEQIFQLLGPRCYTLATTVIQMYSTDGPDGIYWLKRDTGVICFVRDTNRRSYFFRLFCLQQGKLIWEHEIYSGMNYLTPRSYLHTFEAEDRIIAFNFANESEAAHLKDSLFAKLKRKEQKRSERQKNRSVLTNSENSINRPFPRSPHVPNLNTMSNGYASSVSSIKSTNSGKKFKKKSITKADIGIPQNFQHISHVGWDPNTGFELGNVDESIRQFFDKAGISETHLKDKKTRAFIYDFIEKHGGLDAVKYEIHQAPVPPTQPQPPPPPVPARNAPPSVLLGGQHPAPPPPPSAPPPFNVVIHRTHDHGKKTVAPLPNPNLTTISAVRAPPPSPPMPPPPMPADIPNSLPAQTCNEHLMSSSEPRSALMEAIRSGTTLKHVDTETIKASIDSPRKNLLNEIQKGIELKPVQQSNKPTFNALPADGLAGALARALAERSNALRSDSSDTSETIDTDEEWND